MTTEYERLMVENAVFQSAMLLVIATAAAARWKLDEKTSENLQAMGVELEKLIAKGRSFVGEPTEHGR